MKTLPNIHPGEVLLEEFLIPLGISQNALARAAGVSPRRINEIVLGKRGITADTAVRLSVMLGTTERFWLGLQADYDLEEARRTLGKNVRKIERLAARLSALWISCTSEAKFRRNQGCTATIKTRLQPTADRSQHFPSQRPWRSPPKSSSFVPRKQKKCSGLPA